MKDTSRQAARAILIFISAMLVACASTGPVASIANTALELTGLKVPEAPKAPEIPDWQRPARNVSLRIHAGENLNTTPNNEPHALIVKIYKLRQNSNFQRLPYDVFLNPQKEKEMLATDLIEVKEITLIPGQKYQVDEKVTREAYFIGVVGLYRAPALNRWRLSFASENVEKTGITIGAHGCALTVGAGQVIETTNFNPKFLNETRCQ
jgi:type VI secretion system protein VasD